MKIELDRDKKIALLRWLQQGYIETADIELMTKVVDNRTPEEIKANIERLNKLYNMINEDMCKRKGGNEGAIRQE